jgi:hypothetical protein
MKNGYIALLGDSYSKVKSNRVANARYQQATLIVGYLKIISKERRRRIIADRRYLYALVPVLDDDNFDAVVIKSGANM